MEDFKTSFDTVIDRRNTSCGRWDDMDLKYNDPDIIHLGVADMDFRSPDAIIEGFNKVVDHGIFGYTDLNNEFYTSIQRWMKDKNGFDVDKESIVFCPRITISASLIVRVLTEIGDSVIINTPAYTPLKNAITLNNREVIESKLIPDNGRFVMDFDDLESKVTKNTRLFILCSPHNPTGIVWTRKELEQLGNFCTKHDLIILTDEIHSDIISKDCSFTSCLDISEELNRRVILCSSMTKTFNIPGVIVSYMIVPDKDIQEKIRKEILLLGMNNPNIFSVAAVEAAYNRCDDWLVAVNEYIDENYMLLKDSFDTKMPKFNVYKKEGTYLAWVGYQDLGISEQELEQWFTKEAKVSVYNGSAFGKDGIGFIRINLASSKVLLLEALTRLEKSYHKLLK